MRRLPLVQPWERVRTTSREPTTSKRARRAVVALAALALVLAACAPAVALSKPRATRPPMSPAALPAGQHAGRCPWATPAALAGAAPAVLAREVLAHMSLGEKLHFLILVNTGHVENTNRAIPSLCIPALALQDGPDGIANGARGVTQLPAPLALAATFDLGLASAYGKLEGAEARSKGIDVLQSPELNLDRVPTSGRAFEAFGEDPLLTGAMGTAVANGVQSQGVMAQVKHFPLYNQETARQAIDQQVSRRVLEEIYFRPFQMVISGAHIGAVMCEYGSVNGTNACQDAGLFKELASWGFSGFVRSDFMSVTNVVAAFKAGLSLLKPASFRQLRFDVASGRLAVRAVNAAVEAVLAGMFRYGLITHPRKFTPGVVATSAAHAALALKVAQASIVLLKNRANLLPLSVVPGLLAHRALSLAVIGTDAGSAAMTSGFGSSYVRAGSIVAPLASIRARLNTPGTIRVDGVTSLAPPVAIPRSAIVRGSPLPSGPGPADEPGESQTEDFDPTFVPRADLTATSPRSGARWKLWSATVRPRASGLYTLSLISSGDTFFTMDGRPVLSSLGLHARSSWSAAVELRAGTHYRFAMRWFALEDRARPAMKWQYATPFIERAVAVARSASVAIVFANDVSGEGADRPSLSLPGYENALISAVSAVNPHTVVVLNTGGPVLMPWLSRVAAVLEAWYPGQQDGAAIANVLFGRGDPSGHLPVTFPRSSGQGPAYVSSSSYPGVNGTVTYSEGLDIGYRYFQAHHQEPLFAFGFGLSYTSFSLSRLAVISSGGRRTSGGGSGLTVHVSVTNTGHYSGTAVVQVYVGFPAGAGEPPLQLAGFAPVPLRPGASAGVVIQLGLRSFEAFLHGRFTTLAGDYRIEVGQSSASLPLSASFRAPG